MQCITKGKTIFIRRTIDRPPRRSIIAGNKALCTTRMRGKKEPPLRSIIINIAAFSDRAECHPTHPAIDRFVDGGRRRKACNAAPADAGVLKYKAGRPAARDAQNFCPRRSAIHRPEHIGANADKARGGNANVIQKINGIDITRAGKSIDQTPLALRRRRETKSQKYDEEENGPFHCSHNQLRTEAMLKWRFRFQLIDCCLIIEFYSFPINRLAALHAKH